jgi:hypothetical protein
MTLRKRSCSSQWADGEDRAYELDLSLDQVMTACKVALANLVMSLSNQLLPLNGLFCS